MRKILCLSVIFLLCGCCSETKYKKLLNSKLNITENELIEQEGNPTSVYDTPEKRSLEYEESSTACTQYGCFTDWCTTQFIIKNGRVEKWSYKGNACCIY